MTISRKGFVYRTAYPKWMGDYQPAQVSVCKLFWRFLAVLFLLIPLGAILTAIASILMFLIAYRPVSMFSPPTPPDHYQRWPTIRGHQIWPISVLAPAGLIALLVASSAARAFLGRVGIIYVVLAAVILFFITKVILVIRKSEPVQLAAEYLRAKKQKVCPYIRVTD